MIRGVVRAVVLAALFFAGLRGSPALADSQCPFITAYPSILPASNTTALSLLCSASGYLDVYIAGGSVTATTTFPFASGAADQNAQAAAGIGVLGYYPTSGKMEPLQVNSAGALVIAGTVGTTFPFTTVGGGPSAVPTPNSAIAISLYNQADNAGAGGLDVLRQGISPSSASTPLPANTPGVPYVQGPYAGGAHAIVAFSPIPVAISTAAGNVPVVFGSAQPVTLPTNSPLPVVVATGSPIPISVGSPLVVTFNATPQPVTLPVNSPQPVTVATGSPIPIAISTAAGPLSVNLGATPQPVTISGGSVTASQPYPAGTAQPTPGTNSFVGVDTLDVNIGSAGTNPIYPLSSGVAGTTETSGNRALYVQGPGPSGTFPMTGSISLSGNATIAGVACSSFLGGTTPYCTTSGVNTAAIDAQGDIYAADAGYSNTISIPSSTTNTTPTTISTLGYNQITFYVSGNTSSAVLDFWNSPVAAPTSASGGTIAQGWAAICQGNINATPLSSSSSNNIAISCNVANGQSFSIVPTTTTATTITVTYHLGNASTVASNNGYVASVNNGQTTSAGVPYGLWTSSYNYVYDTVTGGGRGELEQAAASNTDGLNHTPGLLATVQTATGAGSPVACTQSKSLTVTGTGITALISSGLTATGIANIYVCGLSYDLTGTTPTVLINTYSATSGAGCTASSGTAGATLASFGATASRTLGFNNALIWNPSPNITTSTYQNICVTLGGTTPTLNGLITYAIY